MLSGFVAEFELLDDDVMLRVELAAVDLVVQFRGQLALADVVARELARIGIERAEFDVAKAHRHVGIQRRTQHIDFAGDGHGREGIHRPMNIHFCARIFS